MNTFQSQCGNAGISGRGYDRWVERQNGNSTLSKVQHQFWVTKQVVFSKLGKKDDDCIVASDAELDAKLELFKSIGETCFVMQRILDRYQERLCNLATEENAMGRFLKEYGKADKTRAGKMMVAVGKTMSYSGQQRLALRVPLLRLYQEVETFCNRAIEDTFVTVNSMEKTRTEYRASLNWLKNISQELDPDTYKKLERFREVQNRVRHSKTGFDKLKLDCLQKVDLLAASRCNMFSHALILYQNVLLQFCHKTAKTMAQVSESFKGYQHYEFSVVKELTEPSKKLAAQTSTENDKESGVDVDQMLFFDSEYHDDVDTEKKEEQEKVQKSDSLENLLVSLSALSPVAKPSQEADAKSKPSHNIESKPSDALLDFRLDDEDTAASSRDNIRSMGPVDLLTQDPDMDGDTMALLDQILNAPPTTGEASFSADWQAVFGSVSDVQASEATAKEEVPPSSPGPSYLPSQLLDLNLDSQFPSPSHAELNLLSPEKKSSGAESATPEKTVSSVRKDPKQSDMSSWFNLFADLDPLANPDAVGLQKGLDDRYC